ncbi:filamentous haemagglutinin family protein [Methylosinus sp. Sm6]|uniref:filamentous haemagglutinin family protein n=1 Tax=Methylosinus sp. Sm6 TaxID=2866948 RepID=UPI001C9A12E2|nr:filamentous haemagglutinin family protein [Methylosinus sp. Sm6]MBY6239909.1 filamentous hemagglutinin family protein [Methylosinus sp. Sm6]
MTLRARAHSRRSVAPSAGFVASFSRKRLLAGASALVLAAFVTQGFEGAAARPLGGASVPAPAVAAVDGANAAAQQAATIARQSESSLTRATQAIQAMQAAQAAARAAAGAAVQPQIADGLSLGGGGRLPGLVVDPRVGSDPNLWINADLPKQSVGDGKTEVTIKQNAAQAVMTWLYYNVSPNTSVVYDQQGHENWVALNRIDATGAPSRILGQIKADGTVLLINPNGIIFGAGSQVNVHSLIASSLDIDGTAAASVFNGNAAYNKMTFEIAGLGAVTAFAPPNEAAANRNFVGTGSGQGLFPIATKLGVTVGNSTRFSMGTMDGVAASQAPGGGAIVVERGASLTTSVNETDDGGYVALLGPRVANSGSIKTQNGQVILAAQGSALLSEPQATATGVHTSIVVDQDFSGGENPSNSTFTSLTLGGAGLATNDGLLFAPNGAVTISSDRIEQKGVVAATTSVARPGSITFSASGDVIFGGDSVTTILPDEGSGTTPAGTATPDYFADSLQPRIEISGAGVDFQSGSLLRAPSAAVVIRGFSSPVLLESGATIDVSGLADVQVPVSKFLVTFVVTPNEVADSPLAAALIGQTVTIDTRLSGTRADGVSWVGSPVVDASGYAGLIPKTIEELLTVGGSLNISGKTFIQQRGSVVDLSGGYVTYTGGAINTTRLIGADGRFYDIGSADPGMRYVGSAAAGGFTVNHSRWGVSETYVNSLLNRAHYEETYIAGASAGSLSTTAIPILDGTIIARTVAGLRQRANAVGGGATRQTSLEQLPAGASLTITRGGNYLLETSEQAGDDPYGLADYAYGADYSTPTTVALLTDRLSATGFGSIEINPAGDVQPVVNMAEGATLTVAAGGAVDLAGVQRIDGVIRAAGGSITLTGSYASADAVSAPPPLVLGSHAELNVRGLWVNDQGAVGDALQGAAFVNGGSVSINTVAASYRLVQNDDSHILDATQSIILSSGSVIDVSSGGYVRADGQLKLGADGLPVGRGGNLSLRTYVGDWVALNPNANVYNEHPSGGNQPNAATVVLGGTIRSEGLGAGGKFTLQAPTVTIDGAANAIASYTSGERSGEVVLPARFFAANGFSDYALTSVYGSSTVTAGTHVLLQQTSYLPTDALTALPTGADLRDVARIGLAPDGLRNPVSFALGHVAYVYGETGPSTTAGVLLDSGARIVAEASAKAQASVRLESLGGSVTVLGAITVPGGEIELRAERTNVSGSSRLTVTVGAEASLDVSGVFVRDPTQIAYRTGVALDGGSIDLFAERAIDVQRGARLLLEGTSASVEIPSGAALSGERLVAQPIWSDGGVLTLDGPGAFAGTVSARGGAPLANNGSLVVTDPTVIEQAGVVGVSTSRYATADSLVIGVDTLNSSGFDSLSLPDVSFVGSMSVALRGSLILGGMLTARPGSDGSPAMVALDAGYVWLRQSDIDPSPARTGDGVLQVSAQWIDIGTPDTHVRDEGSQVTFRNFGSVTLESADAIRLIGSNVSSTRTGNRFVGSLAVAGDLTLKAAEIYPTSGTSFTLRATGKITVEQNGVASAPLSAGGSIILDAREIVQNGTLWAPFGQVVLGNKTTTASVTLGAGSLTSVSGAGTVVPYGYTVDGERWFVGDTTSDGKDYEGFRLTSSPARAITLNGAEVDTLQGARLDLSGGGDIYASEFVAGVGGSQNVLAGPNVYALVPTSSARVAPYDPTFASSATGAPFDSSLLNATAGQAIYISGGNGVPAGYYTLMPGMYATLPGAYRVTVASASTASAASWSLTSMDGSIYVTGQFANLITGARSSQNMVFQLQAQSTWSRYSQIDITSGARYIRELALTAGTAIPALPLDGGALTFAARDRLSIGGSFDFSAGESPLETGLTGVGGQLAISAAKILVLASDKTPAPGQTGYLTVDADQISRVGATTVLIGGSSSVDSSGDLAVTGVATDVEIATDASHRLTAPELVVVTRAGGGGIVVDEGAAIGAIGTAGSGGDRDIVVDGDGSLLRVSAGAMVSVTRSGATAQNGGILISENVSIAAVALTIDSSGSNRLGANVALTAKAFDLSAKIVDFGGDGASGGLVLSDAIIANFAGADSVRLRSASAINFHDADGLSIGDAAHPIGALILDGGGVYGEGGETRVFAANIVLTNTRGASTTANGLTGRDGRLRLDATQTITRDAGSMTANGFGRIDLVAGEEIRFSGSGSLTARNGSGDADVVLSARNVIAMAGSAQSLKTSGALTIVSTGAATAVTPTEIGGSLSLTAASILSSGALTALGGTLALTATEGDVTLAAGALVNASGTRVAIGGVTQDTPGGTVRIASQKGDVTIEDGAKVTVAASGRGYAGGVYIATGAEGVTTLHGAFDASAAYKDSGGTFVLSTGSIVGDLPWNGFTRRFETVVGHGDLVVPTGQTLNSTEVRLVANRGSVIVDGTIDASGPTGGVIGLYGAGETNARGVTTGGVAINAGAKLLARYAAPEADDPGYANGEAELNRNGGSITLGVTGYWDGVRLNADGSERVTREGSGKIVVASGATIDVSAGAGGTGGTVSLRAPVVTDADGRRDVNVSFYENASDSVIGASAVTLNAFAVWSTTDPTTRGAGRHFDGVIDPAGWFRSNGTRVAGTTDPVTGIFTPSGSVNANHVTFYQQTLLGFVNDPFGGAQATVEGHFGENVRSALHLRPEIDLYNPSASVNGGNITVASNWNFGAGSIDKSGAFNLLYRTTNGGEPGTLVLRAANNIDVKATITDGFYVRYDVGGAGATDAATLYNNEINSGLYQTYLTMFSNGALRYSAQGLNDLVSALGSSWGDFGLTGPANSSPASADFFDLSQSVFNSLQFSLRAPTVVAGSAEVVDQYNQYYAQYLEMFRAYETELTGLDLHGIDVNAANTGVSVTGGNIVSYADYSAILSAVVGSVAIDPSTLVVPTAPTTSSAYYDIRHGLGAIQFAENGSATTSASDYATRWAAYFYSTINLNIFNMTQTITLSQVVSDLTLSSAAGADAAFGALAAVAVTPPFAPPAYTTLQPGYVSSETINPPHPADLIANNPAIYSVGNVAVSNTTSAASLMPVSLGNSFSYDLVAGASFLTSNKASVDPNAVVSRKSAVDATAPKASIVISGHTSYDFTYVDTETHTTTIHIPTMLRTGTGSITLAAAGNVEFTDEVVQGAVYTAGAAAATPSDYVAPSLTSSYLANPNGLVSTPAWGTGGGSVDVAVGGSIIGLSSARASETWADWLIHYGASDGDGTPFSACDGGAIACQTATFVNYAAFFQQFGALGGGDVTLRAGRDITDISASLPETMIVAGGFSASDPAHAIYYGGGNLLVQAGGDLNSGTFLVGRGVGRIEIGGSVRQTADNPITRGRDAATYPLMLAAQNGFVSIVAKGDITLGTMLDPTTTQQYELERMTFIQNLTPIAWLPGFDGTGNVLWGNSFTSYGAQAGLSLLSVAGNVNAMTLAVDNSQPDGPGRIASSSLLPPSLSVTALQGNVTIGEGGSRTILAFPTDGAGHDTGGLTLAAAGSIVVDLQLDTPSAAVIGTAAHDSNYVNPLGLSSYSMASTALSTSGPVVVGADVDLDGALSVNRPAQINVGRDIGSDVFTFIGLNFTDADVTSFVAGRDIGGAYHLYGPGSLLIQAGRNVRRPLNASPENEFSIYTIGNGSGGTLADGVIPTLHSYLPDEGASIFVLYGVASGVDYDTATRLYVDPASAATSGVDLLRFVASSLGQSRTEAWTTFQGLSETRRHLLIDEAFLSYRYEQAVRLYIDPASAGTNGVDFLALIAASLGQSREEAWTSFQNLSATRQRLMIDEAFLSFLTSVATDYRDSSSPYYLKYSRAYEVIDTLFPKSERVDPAAVGRLVTPYSLIETQAGGDINVIGPVGGIRVGSAGRDTLTPDKEGILTLRGGAIRIYTDQTVLVNQSRIMTQQGGNVEIFSGNGDIDAGSGPKTYVANPVLSEVCNYSTGYCSVNPQGLVTGAGIGAIVTLPSQDPSLSNAVLSAPRGTVDAGAAGIRVSGNLVIVAQRVSNGANISFGGNASGLPASSSSANVGALTSASSTAGAAAKAVETPRAGNAGSDAPSIITVEVLGYGGSEHDAESAGAAAPPSNGGADDQKRRRR